MANERRCLSCGESLPPGNVGGNVRCPRCGIVVPDLGLGEGDPLAVRGLPPAPGPLVPRLVSSSIDETRPPPRRSEPAQVCPQCGASLHPDEPRCFRCGLRLWEERARPEPVRRDREPHRGPLIGLLGKLSLVLGLASFAGVFFLPLAAASVPAAALGIGAAVMARDDLEQMEKKTMDPEGEEATRTGQQYSTAGIVLAILGALISLVVKVPTVLRS